ncbi:4-(cytidine 5'-diphospho)-2-C-methyl-D-erythritol kinase [Guyparkeria sp. SB14A]|uniref:4-(cytidine 5'-diphospho)-2-C-methyl-D-erythritol kinase n=1 Tax=Guyparkeria sp. SB14A TaxID=2571147 RepID=UPI0010AD6E14|nr:4-(cytidine 5'-diphospho)-2-C-methyl-D-erythritol kinase [Guyparkeria sp. SB14A]TKA91196.1 4-(cytidine 5'-diphospho)-2-C-methyl-D-erythritol kinase [Guyparkeria sp. SB14A]
MTADGLTTDRPLENATTKGGSPAWRRAGSKLNLYLHINARRPDGYHELQTFFELLDYGDELLVDTNPEDIRVDWIAGDEPIDGRPTDPGDDLLYRTALRLRQYAHDLEQAPRRRPLGAHITLKKHAPVGGGLGGGSAAAACLLLALNREWALDLSRETLAEIGRELGADVPVFVRGESATAHGIGEELHPGTAGQTTGTYLVLIPALSSPTARLFAADGLKRDTPKRSDTDLLEHWRQGATNVFEPLLLAAHPALAALRDDLESQAGFARVTGSGACLFAPVTSADEGRRIGHALAAKHPVLRRYFVSRSVGNGKSAS